MPSPFSIYIPVPPRATICGLPTPLSLMERVALRAPVAVGLKTTLKVQLAPPATDDPQVLVCEKSFGFVPMMVTLVIVSAVVPTLVRVTVFAALLCPTPVDGKFSTVGDRNTVVPVPVKGTVCGLPPPVSLMETVALRVPLAVGVKVTLIVQLAPAPSEEPQVLVWAKSPGLVPVMVMPVMLMEVVPTFFIVTVFAALLWPIAVVGKFSTAGISETTVPVPVSEAVCVPSLSVTLTEAVRVPDPMGLNVTVMAHVIPPPSEVGQVLVCEKSAAFGPVIVMLLIVTAVVPVFLTVIFCGLLAAPTSCVVNVRLLGVRVTPPALVPLPVRLTVCGLLLALSAMLTVPVRVPVVVGMNVTLIVQLPLGGTVPGQLLV